MGEINEFLRIKKEIEETFDNATDAEIKFLLEGDSGGVPLKKKLFFQKKQLELIALGNHNELMDIILLVVIAKEMGRKRGH